MRAIYVHTCSGESGGQPAHARATFTHLCTLYTQHTYMHIYAEHTIYTETHTHTIHAVRYFIVINIAFPSPP